MSDPRGTVDPRRQYEQLQNAQKTLEMVRRELSTLEALGDMVTPEDVIKGAGKLVAGGLSPRAMSGLLADMPHSGGVALQGWLSQHSEQLAQREAQLEPMMAVARHVIGVGALHQLMSMSSRGSMAPPQGTPLSPQPSMPPLGQQNAN